MNLSDREWLHEQNFWRRERRVISLWQLSFLFLICSEYNTDVNVPKLNYHLLEFPVEVIRTLDWPSYTTSVVSFCLNGLVLCTLSCWKVLKSSAMRRMSSSLHISYARTNQRKNTITIIGPKLWNKQSLFIRDSPSLKIFKLRIQTENINSYLSQYHS